jgi:hypothetical protein
VGLFRVEMQVVSDQFKGCSWQHVLPEVGLGLQEIRVHGSTGGGAHAVRDGGRAQCYKQFVPESAIRAAAGAAEGVAA